MNEIVTIRVVGESALVAVQNVPSRKIRDDIYEVTLPLESETIRGFFKTSSGRWSNLRNGWYISWWKIERSYSKSEYANSPLIHARPFRAFAEAMPELDYYEYNEQCRCKVPLIQTRPIILDKSLKCKDELIQLSDGAWACKPSFAHAVLESGLEPVPFTPIFGSKGKAARWKADQGLGVYHQRSDLQFLPSINEHEIDEFDWLQMHPKLGGAIIHPTDGRQIPHTPNSPSEDCGCSEVYSPGLSSELYLEDKNWTGDWNLTRQFIGTSGGVFLPQRQLIVSQRAFHFLTHFRLKNIEFDCTHLVGPSPL